MSQADLFLGVVSHPRSRFARETEPGGSLWELGRHFQDTGVLVDFVVESRNLFSENPRPLTSADVQESLDAQLVLDRSWERYVGGSATRRLVRSMVLGAGRLRRRISRPPIDSVERLLNIEFSHVSLMQQGIRSGASWILIVEDDGGPDDLEDTAIGISALLPEVPARTAYVNLSESFGLHKLNVQRLLRPSGTSWEGPIGRSVLTAERPVTNTVCAIAYRSEFVEQLLAEFSRQGSFPIVPIDWKLNQALMSFYERGQLGDGSCWWVSPAPIKQMSMEPMRSGDTQT